MLRFYLVQCTTEGTHREYPLATLYALSYWSVESHQLAPSSTSNDSCICSIDILSPFGYFKTHPTPCVE